MAKISTHKMNRDCVGETQGLHIETRMVRSNRNKRESTVLLSPDSTGANICHKNICTGDTRTQKEKQVDPDRQEILLSSIIPRFCTYHENSEHTNNESSITEQRLHRERRRSQRERRPKEKQKDSLLHNDKGEIRQEIPKEWKEREDNVSRMRHCPSPDLVEPYLPSFFQSPLWNPVPKACGSSAAEDNVQEKPELSKGYPAAKECHNNKPIAQSLSKAKKGYEARTIHQNVPWWLKGENDEQEKVEATLPDKNHANDKNITRKCTYLWLADKDKSKEKPRENMKLNEMDEYEETKPVQRHANKEPRIQSHHSKDSKDSRIQTDKEKRESNSCNHVCRRSIQHPDSKTNKSYGRSAIVDDELITRRISRSIRREEVCESSDQFKNDRTQVRVFMKRLGENDIL